MQDGNAYILYRAYNPAYPHLGSLSSTRIWLTQEVDYAQLYMESDFILSQVTLEIPIRIASLYAVDTLLGYDFDPIEPTDEECAAIHQCGYDAFECTSAGGDTMICLLNEDKIKQITIM